jgi:hypothetical protein
MGINQKCEQCGYNSQKFYIGKLLCGVLFMCTLQGSLVTSQILALSEVKLSGRYLHGPPSYPVLVVTYGGSRT